eukprot:3522592-Prymnesium_polylepis.2
MQGTGRLEAGAAPLRAPHRAAASAARPSSRAPRALSGLGVRSRRRAPFAELLAALDCHRLVVIVTVGGGSRG